MSLGRVLTEAAAQLEAAGIDSPRLDARVLLGAVLGVSPAAVPSHAGPLSAAETARFTALILRRAAREPIAYILGYKEFWSLDFAVGPGVLVPRPDSETLIEAALATFPDRDAPLSIADLGCGSGCLIITALHLWPKAQGLALDLSSTALDYTRRNAERLGVAGRLRTLAADFGQARGRFDLVLCNPPYLSDAELSAAMPELRQEPETALRAGADGCAAYRQLGAVFAGLLHPGAVGVVELGAGQEEAVRQLFLRAGLDVMGVKHDLSSVPRALIVRLSAT